MYKIFFTFILLILVPATLIKATDSSTILKGRNSDYAGDTLVFLSYSNMISFSEKEVGRCAVDDSGFFECRISLSNTQHIFTYLGAYNCYLYAQPGMLYTLRLPARRDLSPQEITDPFYEETAIHLSVKATSGKPGNDIIPADEELNFTIRAFNDAFYPYYYKFVINAYGQRLDRKEIEKAEQEIRAPYDSIPGSFLKGYIHHRIGLLKHYGSQVSNNRIIQDYFLRSHVLYNNPAYMELFNQIFKDYFLAFAEENPGARLPILLNREKDYEKVNAVLEKEASLKNDSLRELVLLKGLYDGIYDGKNISSSMIQLLDSVRMNTGNEIHKQAVRDIMLEISKILPGYEPPDFTLYDSDSTLVHLSDFKGDYVYLNFCNSYGYYCVREFEYLRILHKRLKDRLQIVTILVDDSYESMHNLVKNNSYQWTFLHFSNQPDVLDDYDIRTYPYYFLIGPEGNMILSPAPSPEENFESTFNRILIHQK